MQTNQYRQAMLSALFENNGIDRVVFDNMTDSTSGIKNTRVADGFASIHER